MNFFDQNFEILIGTISTIIASVVAFFTGQKSKEKFEEGNALKTTQEVYDELVKDVQQKFDNLKQEMREVKEENREQRADLRTLQKDNSKLHLEVAQLTRENHELKELCRELKIENQTLRNELKKYKNAKSQSK